MQTILDGDGHILESDGVQDYLEPAYRRNAYRDHFPLDGWNRNMGGRLGSTTVRSAQTWLQGLELGGMSQAVLFPTLGLFSGFIRNRDVAVALCRAYNSFVAEQYRDVDARLQPVALLPVQDPAEAVKELRRAVNELKLVGAMLVADGAHPLLGDERYHPLYAAAQELDTTLAIHASGSHLGGAGVDLFPQFIHTHTVSHPFGIMRQLTSYVFDGIPDRFPKLRMAFLEAGVTWVPYWMDRMDEEYEKRGAVEAPHLRRKPSEAISGGTIFFSMESGESLLPQALDKVGEDHVIYASDYPHWDNEYPESVHHLRSRSDISEARKTKLFETNTRRLFKL